MYFKYVLKYCTKIYVSIGEDNEINQNLLESVYEILEKMEEIGTHDPIEYAQIYNQSLEASHMAVFQQKTVNYNSKNIYNPRINDRFHNTTILEEFDDEGTAEDLLERQSIARQTGLTV